LAIYTFAITFGIVAADAAIVNNFAYASSKLNLLGRLPLSESI